MVVTFKEIIKAGQRKHLMGKGQGQKLNSDHGKSEMQKSHTEILNKQT